MWVVLALGHPQVPSSRLWGDIVEEAEAAMGGLVKALLDVELAQTHAHSHPLLRDHLRLSQRAQLKEGIKGSPQGVSMLPHPLHVRWKR